MSNEVNVLDKTFVPFIERDRIAQRVCELGKKISTDYEGKNPKMIAILNGSFVFAADLFRAINIEATISFVKLSSYKGTQSTGQVTTAFGLEEDLAGRHIILIEDIVDTGSTMNAFLPELYKRNTASIKIATFLSKPEALLHKEIKPDYVAFEIENKFVLGYGLDYNGYGRNLPDLYVLKS